MELKLKNRHGLNQQLHKREWHVAGLIIFEIAIGALGELARLGNCAEIKFRSRVAKHFLG